ncbi:MAG: hypothetical protein IJT59_00845 [Desulfovibrionaceae bacterium]|nr:hypothetical protein [Desulfovibrionaceae bacterium]
MVAKDLDLAFKIAEAEINQKICRLKEKLKATPASDEDLLTIAEIEELWADFNSSSSKIFADLLASYLAVIDEQATLSLKKKSPKPKISHSKSTKKAQD